MAPNLVARPGFIIIWSPDPNVRVTVSQGESPPKLSEGYGNWETIDRPRRIGITEWKNSKPFKLTISVLFDGHLRGGASVEQQVANLESLARGKGGNKEPAICRVVLPLGLPRGPAQKWVIQDIDWGDSIYSTKGFRTRQWATVEFLQYTNDDHIKITNAKKKRKPKGARKKTYRVKRGDNLHKIAAKTLGSSKRWREIARLNKIRDGQRLRVGRILKLP